MRGCLYALLAKLPVYSHRIGGNRERRVVNNFSFSIAKINVFDCQNRYNGNRKTPNLSSSIAVLAIENALFSNR